MRGKAAAAEVWKERIRGASSGRPLTHPGQPFAINVRRNFRWLDLAPPAPENVGVAHRHPARCEVLVDRALCARAAAALSVPCATAMMLTFLNSGPAFAPVAVGENMVPARLRRPPRFRARRNRPVEKRVEPRHAHAGRGRFHVLEEGGETPDDLARVERLGHAIKLLQRNARFRARAPSRASAGFPPARTPVSTRAGPPIRGRSAPPTCTGAIFAG